MGRVVVEFYPQLTELKVFRIRRHSMKNNKKFTLILIGMAIFIAFLGSVNIMMKHEREKLYDSLDAAREAYRNDIKKADIC